MSTYELPDGFQSMETAPKNTWVNVIDASGNYGRDIYLEGRYIYRFAPMWIGWSPVVPPKKKRRFKADWCSIRKCWTVRYNPPTVTLAACLDGLSQDTPEHRNAAQAVADIYEQAYEATP